MNKLCMQLKPTTMTLKLLQLEAVVVRVVDASARPGARNISAENFVERMRELENVANSFPGIDKSYTPAGREVRIIVRPEKVDDLLKTISP